jgi:molybdopterin converting factor small subunit
MKVRRAVKVEVLLFGPAAGAVGRDRLTVEVPDDAPTCGRVCEAMIDAEPKLRRLVDGGRMAVNQRLAPEDQQVSERDEIALIGLVSGG